MQDGRVTLEEYISFTEKNVLKETPPDVAIKILSELNDTMAVVQLLTQLFHKIDADADGRPQPVRLECAVRTTNPAARFQVISASTSRLRRIRRWRRS